MQVDQRDAGSTGEFPYFNVACAFAFSDWHANFEVCVIFLVLRAMMQHERLAADVPAKLFSQQGKTLACITVFFRHAQGRDQHCF